MALHHRRRLRARRRAGQLLKIPLWLLLALPGAARTESLTDAWRMARETDASLAAAHSAREAAEADRSAAVRMRWPTVELTGGYTQFQNAPNLQIDTPAGRLQAPIWRHDSYTMAGADISVPLWTSGRISGAIGAAAANAKGANAEETQSAAELRLAVAEAYVGVFRAQRALAVAESGVASLEAHAGDVQVKFDKEAVAQSDLLAAKVALANVRQQRLRAANAVRLSTAAYNRLVGQPLERVPELDEPPVAAPGTSGQALERLIARAQDRRPELAAVEAQSESYRSAARAERAAGWPQIALHAGYNHLDNQILDRENFATVGVGFQWRLFDSGQVSARAAALRLRSRAADQQLANLRSRVALEVETAVLNREEAAARTGVAAEAVAQAEENLRIARELYGSGLGTNTQVLDAEALRVMALRNQDDATFDLLVAGYRVERAVGDL